MSSLKNALAPLAAVVGILAVLSAVPGLSVADQGSKPEGDAERASQGTKQVRPRYAVAYSGFRSG